MLRRFVLITAALVAAVVAYALVTAPPKRIALAAPAQKNVVFGAYHVHTTRSDGAFTPDQVADAARHAKLQFVVMTDHGDATRAPDPPRYVNGVLLIDAVEVSAVEGHVVALGLPGAAPYRLGGEARDVIEDVHRLGGFAVVAHPDSPRPDLRWRATNINNGRGAQSNDLSGADGLEWLNADSEWRDEPPQKLLQALINFPVRRSESLARLMSKPGASLRRWDALTRRRPVVALSASDAHGIGGRFYAEMFGTMAQAAEMRDAWSGDAAADAALLLDAIRRGHAWSVISAFAGPAVAHLSATSGNAPSDSGIAAATAAATALPTATMGESLSLTGGPVDITASVDGASHARVSLWHNDREIASGLGEVTFRGAREPGAYRAEAYLNGFAMPWIVTNPVYLDPAPATTNAPVPSARMPGRPGATAPAEPDEVVAPLPPSADWVVEHGPSSSGTVTPGDGRDDSVRFQFQVGTMRPGLEFAALAHAVGDGTESFDRVEFIGSASAPMRVLVQFRLPSAGDTERWSRSVYLDQTPRAITVRMMDVAPVGITPIPTRRPVAARVKTLLFVLDTLNTAPGTSGEVLLKNVRLARGTQALSGPNGQQQVRRPGQK